MATFASITAWVAPPFDTAKLWTPLRFSSGLSPSIAELTMELQVRDRYRRYGWRQRNITAASSDFSLFGALEVLNWEHTSR
jgi:hypothetical protein